MPPSNKNPPPLAQTKETDDKKMLPHVLENIYDLDGPTPPYNEHHQDTTNGAALQSLENQSIGTANIVYIPKPEVSSQHSAF